MDESTAMLSVQPLVRKITDRFAWLFQLDRRELESEMQLVVLDAVRDHDPEKRTLASWIHFRVTQAMKWKLRSPKFREQYSLMLDASETLYAAHAHTEDFHSKLDRLLLEVSCDAAKAIQLVIREGVKDRSYIEMLLHTSYGWTEQQINRVFAEVHSVLGELS